MTTQPLINLQSIKKVFYTDEMETTALDNIHLSIEEGEYVSISGPSGCGKSTLLSVMGLLNSCTEGRYFLNGAEVMSLPSAEQARVRNREIGFIFQAFNLISDMSAFENVELPLTFRNDLTRKQRHELVVAALEQVNISERQKHYPAQMSGGQQQRVACARALVGKPKVLLADEPTGEVDAATEVWVLELMEKYCKDGGSVVVATHSAALAQKACRIVRLADGKVGEDG